MVAYRLSDAADPRARLLRKRRWALRLGLFFGFASVFWVLVTGLLATWSTPVWVLLITGLIGAGAAFPAALLLMRYRWLRRRVAAAAACRQQPSAAAAGVGGAAGDVGAGSLRAWAGVADRRHASAAICCPPTRSANCRLAAQQSAAAMAATAAEVVSMERAAAAAPQSRAHLAPTINAFTAQLGAGVRQYNEMVTAAAQLVSSANGGPAAGRR